MEIDVILLQTDKVALHQTHIMNFWLALASHALEITSVLNQ